MKKLTPIIAIAVIGALLAYAISQQIDGKALAIGVCLIAGLAGYFAPHKTPKP